MQEQKGWGGQPWVLGVLMVHTSALQAQKGLVSWILHCWQEPALNQPLIAGSNGHS